MQRESWRRRYPLFPRLLFVLDGTGPAGIDNRIDALNAATRQLSPLFLHDVPILATAMTELLQHGPAAPVWRPAAQPDHRANWMGARRP
ncbi:hypothetical protein ABZ400_34285 [Streptomyces sp. NPDC005897]|uniref:hypothetical protein n=1 Tax=Streptomyces sp. NPDC005897 TaxID=3157081 RepID=UPI0033F3667F